MAGRAHVPLCVLAALVVFALAMPTLAHAQTTGWRIFLGGDDDNTPHEPSGVAIDEQGTLFVSDTAGSRIEKVAANGRVLMTFGHIGTGADAVRRPRGIALDGHGALLVADTANHRIQRFDAASGEPLGTWGVIGSGPGEFILPTSVALDSTGNVFVADTGNHRLQKLSPSGEFILEWGGLHFPHGVAVASDDSLYVTDSDGLRHYSSSGDLLGEWTAPGQFGDPYGVTVGSDDTLYVADTDNGRVVAVSPSGKRLASWGAQGRSIGQFKYPEAVALDASGNLYVADRGNDRIQLLRR